MAFEESVSEKEAEKFRAENDERVKKAREGMGYEAPAAEEPAEVEEPKEVTPEEESEEESDDTVSTEEEPEEEVEEESDDTEEEPESQPRDKSVFRQLNEIRSQKRAVEAEKQKLLDDYTKILEENKTLKANQPPPQPFVDFAKKQGISDPKQVVEMYDLFKSNMEADFGSKISALDEKIQQFEAKENERAEQGAYTASMEKLTDEWSEVLPVIEAEYKPSAEQVDKVFSLMADLAHSEKYHDKELDYILFKEAPAFEEILGARRRRTMFSSRGRVSTDTAKPTIKRDGSHESIMALKREQDAKKAGSDGFDVIQDSRII